MLDGAFRITNDVIVQPGESVILCEAMSRSAFVRWWGEDNLPVDLQVLTYNGNGFRSEKDCVFLWNSTALERTDSLTCVCFVNLADHFEVRYGVSLWFDPVDSEFGDPSVAGERGAFRASASDDAGSPGWTRNGQRIVRPRVTAIHRNASGVAVTWSTEPNKIYELHASDTLEGGVWAPVARLTATQNSLTGVDTVLAAPSQRFYRIFRVP